MYVEAKLQLSFSAIGAGVGGAQLLRYEALTGCCFFYTHTHTRRVCRRVWGRKAAVGWRKCRGKQPTALLLAVWGTVCLCVRDSVFSCGFLPAWDRSPSFYPWVSLALPESLPCFPPTRQGSSCYPHDEGGGPPEPSAFLDMWRDGIPSTSTPRRAKTYPQCLLWRL